MCNGGSDSSQPLKVSAVSSLCQEEVSSWPCSLAGTGQITGDIVSPASEEDDWETLRRSTAPTRNPRRAGTRSYLVRRFALAGFGCAFWYFFIAFRSFFDIFFSAFLCCLASFRARRIFSPVLRASA